MKQALTILTILYCLVLSGTTSAQSWEWARTATNTRPYSITSSTESWPLATDKQGNVYTAFSHTNDSLTLGTNKYHAAIYKNQTIIAKYDYAGNILWSKASTNGNAMPIAIATDNNDNLFVYGYFLGDSVRFGSHLIVRTSATASNTCFLIKFDKDGNLLWKTNAGSLSDAPENQACGSIATDAAGNCYLAATYSDASLSVGSYSLTNSGYEDIYLCRYSPTGAISWAKKFGGNGYDRVSGITVSNNNKVYITGEFSSSSIVFGNTALSFSATLPPTTSHRFNTYLVQMGIDGNVQWARQCTGDARATSIATDTVNDIYIGGVLADDRVVFGSYTLNDNANTPFLVKYDGTGNVINAHAFTQTIPSAVLKHAIWSIDIDPCNNVWVSGGLDSSYGNGIFLDTSLILPVPQSCTDPMFIACYNEMGGLLDYATLRSGGDNNSTVRVNDFGNIYIAGDYLGVAPLILGTDTLGTYPNVSSSYFLAKYVPISGCEPTSASNINALSNGFTVFPNPVSFGELKVTGNERIQHITITDMLGRKLYEHRPNTVNTSINISTLVPGTYLVDVNGQYKIRFVKE